MMKKLALAAIRCYQRLISPHKGFRCAYRALTGHASCSALGYRVIRRFGVWRGIRLLRQRLYKCGVAYRRYALPPGPLARQAGFIDCNCDLPCELPGASCSNEAGSCACDLLSGCDAVGDCGGSSRKKARHDSDEAVHLPPRQ